LRAKCLDEDSHAETDRVFLVQNEDGICVSQLLGALEEVSELALDRFNDTIDAMLFYSANMHWKHDIWNEPGRPTISMVFGNTVGLAWLQIYDYRNRIDRQRKWMPTAMFRPPIRDSSEDEDADVLPDIYRIGLDAPLFRTCDTTLQERREDYIRVLERIMSNVETGRHCSDGIPQGKTPPQFGVDCVAADEENLLKIDWARWEAHWASMGCQQVCRG
jgi:hypothetical protein